jgi:nucleotide-binding universal stress UspA family protein
MLAVDPGGRALHALPIVVALARQAAGEVHVVTVAGRHGRELPPSTTSRLQTLIREIAAAGVAVDAEVVGPERSVATGLAGAARRHGADLVALGSYGRSTLGAVLRGSVGMRLAAMIDTPLLMVHDQRAPENGIRLGPIRRVLVAVDRYVESEAAADAARGLAAAHDAAVLVVHVPEVVEVLTPPGPAPRMFGYLEDDEAGEAVLEGARRRLAGLETPISTRLLQGNGTVAARIADTAARWGADVLVVGSRRLTPIGGLLAGSVTRELVRRSDRPVLLAGRGPA